MQFARVNDITIHHQVIGGPAEKPVLVFVNSLGTDFRIWRDVIVGLAGDAPLLTYDKRGHGLSDVGQVPYSIDDHVSDLIGLLETLSVRKAVICGLSVGGMIALGLAARRPDLVSGLILCDTAHKIGTAESWNARIKAVEENGLGSIVDAVMERSRFVHNGRDQTVPQAPSVFSSWNGWSKAVAVAEARSTWLSPSTERRVTMPWR